MRSFVRNSILSALATATVALSGGANAAAVSHVYTPVPNFGHYEDIAYRASMGGLPVYVRGNPFAGDRDGNGVVAALQRHFSQPGLRFVSASGPMANGYRVVLAFGTFAPGADYCANDANIPVAANAGSGSQVVAAFCNGTQLRSLALVTGSPSASPTDRSFDQLMAALSTELFR